QKHSELNKRSLLNYNWVNMDSVHPYSNNQACVYIQYGCMYVYNNYRRENMVFAQCVCVYVCMCVYVCVCVRMCACEREIFTSPGDIEVRLRAFFLLTWSFSLPL